MLDRIENTRSKWSGTHSDTCTYTTREYIPFPPRRARLRSSPASSFALGAQLRRRFRLPRTRFSARAIAQQSPSPESQRRCPEPLHARASIDAHECAPLSPSHQARRRRHMHRVTFQGIGPRALMLRVRSQNPFHCDPSSRPSPRRAARFTPAAGSPAASVCVHRCAGGVKERSEWGTTRAHAIRVRMTDRKPPYRLAPLRARKDACFEDM
ncbi:hypothetical protein FB451DRAFT_1302109, partial [Mycena latifolia]